MSSASLRRAYAKLCDRRDFDDPAVIAAIDDVEPGHPGEERLERKLWEYAQLALFLEEVGALDDQTRVLAVGAGHETPLFWLANRVGEVVATDIYGEGGFAYREAQDVMLTNPSSLAPYPYREDRLQVRWMDARTLEFPDESFDVVFSLSSIEHFGGPADIAARSSRNRSRAATRRSRPDRDRVLHRLVAPARSGVRADGHQDRHPGTPLRDCDAAAAHHRGLHLARAELPHRGALRSAR